MATTEHVMLSNIILCFMFLHELVRKAFLVITECHDVEIIISLLVHIHLNNYGI